MFIGKYESDGETYANIYFKNKNGYEEWHNDTFSPLTENIETLDFKLSGKTYTEKQNNLIEIAKDWQLYFCQFVWSMSELYLIEDWLYKNAKRYGLLKEFHENAIC